MKHSITIILISVAAALLFIPFLGKTHLFDWDEINFAEISREMILLEDYTRVYVDFKPFWEKPPLFFWVQSTSMKIFGVNEFAARFPNALCGIITLIILFLTGRQLLGHRFGILWALAYGGSLFPSLYFKSGIIDPWFNLFIYLSLYYFILYHWKRNHYDLASLQWSPVTYLLISGAWMGLAILTKGQVALMIFGLTAAVYWVIQRFRLYVHPVHVLFFLIAMTIVTMTWYGYETAKNGPWFISEFIKYQYRLFTTHDAGQKGFFGYHYVVIFFGCFPASLLAVRSFFRIPPDHRYEKDYKKWMLILFWVVTILFTIVKSRIIHYSSMAWFPVTFLAAYALYKWEIREIPYRKYVSWLLGVTGVMLSFVLIALPIAAGQLDKIKPYVQDAFAKANMDAEVYWSGWESLIGVGLLLITIIGIILLHRQQFMRAAYVLFGGTAIIVFLASSILIPKIEQYSQGAAMDFFEEKQHEDAYITPLGYKTYGHLFYTKKKPPVHPQSYDIEWLLHGPVDKPVYFISKVDREDRFKQYIHLKELYRKNGFVFLKREPG